MAAESGTEDLVIETSAAAMVPALAPLGAVEDLLRDHPGRFDFFQAVRLLLRLYPDREPVGQFARPSREAVRFNIHNTLVFPPTEVQQILWEGEIPRMIVAFMGLTGPAGVLPYSYSEFVIARLRDKDPTIAAFFDIFNHRMISLFYQAWEKHRSAVAYERDGEDRLSKYLMSLIGLGTPGLQHRVAVRDESLLFYTGLLSLQPRSAIALAKLLEDYFDVPVEVEQFVGAWQSLDPDNQCVFESSDSFSEQLGVGAVVGDEIWDQQSRIRVKLGPLNEDQYLSFLPGGSAYEPLRELSRFFCGTQLEIEAQLVLKRDEVPHCHLGDDGLAGPRLGWFTWMKSGPVQFNEETVHEVENRLTQPEYRWVYRLIPQLEKPATASAAADEIRRRDPGLYTVLGFEGTPTGTVLDDEMRAKLKQRWLRPEYAWLEPLLPGLKDRVTASAAAGEIRRRDPNLYALLAFDRAPADTILQIA